MPRAGASRVVNRRATAGYCRDSPGVPSTYRVGLCARTSTTALNLTDYSNAIAIVANS
jgi:hypothetical protein